MIKYQKIKRQKVLPFITYSKTRAKNLYLFNFYTLSEFINKLHLKNFNSKHIDFIESKYILLNLVKNLNLVHFSFLDINSIEDVLRFIRDVKRNNVKIENFNFEPQKEKELITILNLYNEFLKKNNLADIGDIEKEVLEYVTKNSIKVKSDIFEIDNIHFFESKLQKEIFDKLDKEFINLNNSNNLEKEYLIDSFNIFDEVKNALRLANEFISKNKEVKIIVSNIDLYFPIFENLSNEYGIVCYSTKGKRIIDLDKSLQKQYLKNIELEKQSIINKLEKLNITYDIKDIEKKLKEKRIFIKNGVEITETNQIFMYKEIENLIFVGADISNFPPKRIPHIFYTNNYEELMFLNSTFESAKAIYNQMKKVSKNLFITYPKYIGKNKNSISLIIDKNLPLYTPSIKSNIDLLKENKRVKIDEIEEFINVTNYDEYNGKISSSQVEKYSVSKFNSYLKCPRKFFYSYILKLTQPLDEEKELLPTDKGSIMHKAFELIVKDYPNLKDIDYYKQKALKERELKETIFKKLYEVELIDLIEKFIEYLKEENIQNSQTEVEFYLDEDLNIADKNNYFLKGYIDRIDINEEIEIVDYKISKKDKLDYKKIEEIQNLKDLQLGIYTIYAKQKYKKPITASLLTFRPKKLKFATLKECDKPKIKRNKLQYACYNPEYETNLKSKVKEIKENIKNGYFIYDNSDEEVCEWCEFKLICKELK